MTKTYFESSNCRSELNFAQNSKKKIIPLLAQAGYNFQVDGWLGIITGNLKYYDITHSLKRPATLADMVKIELDFASNAVSGSMPTLDRVPTLRMVTTGIPQNESEIREWVANANLDASVANALVDGKFLEPDLLEDLAGFPPSEIQALLKLELPSTALKLHKALGTLFS